MKVEELYEKMSEIKSKKELRDSIKSIVKSVDAGRMILLRETVRIGVYIPRGLEERLEELSDESFPVILGDNGDGKSTLLKALSLLLDGEYYLLHELKKIENKRYFLDGIDEYIVVDSEGNLKIDERYSPKIGELIARFSSRSIEKGAVIGATLGTMEALFEIRRDAARRLRTAINLRDIREEVNEFILARDLAFYSASSIIREEKLLKMHDRLSREVKDMDTRRRIPSYVNRLYNDFLSEIYKKDPREELIRAPERYHESFEKNSVKLLEKVVEEVSKYFERLEFSVSRLGRSGNPDAEIVVSSPEGTSRIAFDAKFLSDPKFSPPRYTSNYPYVIYFVASLGKPSVEAVRIPYSLGYLVAISSHSVYDYYFYYAPLLKKALYEALSRSSKSGAEIVESKIKKVVSILEELSRDRKKDGSIKAFTKKKLESLGMSLEEFLEIVNQYCEGLISNVRGRYKFESEPDECIKKLESLA